MPVQHKMDKKALSDMTLDVLLGVIVGAIVLIALVSKASDFSKETQTDEAVANQIQLHLDTLASLPYPAELTTGFTNDIKVKRDGIYIKGEKQKNSKPNWEQNIEIKPDAGTAETLQFAYHYGQIELGGTLEESESIPKEVDTAYEIKIKYELQEDYRPIKTILKFDEENDNPDLVISIQPGEKNTVQCFRVVGLCEKIRKDLSENEPLQFSYEDMEREDATVAITIVSIEKSMNSLGNIIDKAVREYYVG